MDWAPERYSGALSLTWPEPSAPSTFGSVTVGQVTGFPALFLLNVKVFGLDFALHGTMKQMSIYVLPSVGAGAAGGCSPGGGVFEII
jgi:hypothetical protein